MAVAVDEITYLDAIREALADALREDDRVLLLGEDIGRFGGAFGVTKGLLELFGRDRVIDTPISEEGFTGAAFGLAWMGERPVVELQFADFATCAFDQIVTVGAKTHWRQGIRLPVVIRAPFGGGIRGGPFHASCPEGFFCGVPGLKVVCPATAADAYGLLRSAIEDDDPVLFFEHKALYRRARGGRPEPTARTPLGEARIARPGRDLTVVAYGAMVAVADETHLSGRLRQTQLHDERPHDGRGEHRRPADGDARLERHVHGHVAGGASPAAYRTGIDEYTGTRRLQLVTDWVGKL